MFVGLGIPDDRRSRSKPKEYMQIVWAAELFRKKTQIITVINAEQVDNLKLKWCGAASRTEADRPRM